jgi:hypothetical protein
MKLDPSNGRTNLGTVALRMSGGPFARQPGGNSLRSRAGLQILVSFLAAGALCGEESPAAATASRPTGVVSQPVVPTNLLAGTIDLPTALRLAGANNLDIQIVDRGASAR